MRKYVLCCFLVLAWGGAVSAQPRAGNPRLPSTLRFRRVAEPKENAFTVLVPEGWQTAGGIVRVNPLTGGGALNAVAAKADFAVKRDAQGTAMIRFLPDTKFVDVRGTPVGNVGVFQPGSNYNGATVYPVMVPATFLASVAFPYAHPQAGPPQVLERKPLPALVEELEVGARYNPVLASFQCAAGMITIAYEEGGIRYREKLATGIVAMGPKWAGGWNNTRAFLVRGPESEFDSLAPIFAIIQNSVKINPQWLAGEIQGQIYRGQKSLEIQQDIQRIERETVEHRQQTNAEIHNDMYLTLTGQEDHVNPFTDEVERGSNEWKYRWVTPSGEEVYSDADNYDPNFDSNTNRTDFKRSAVRERP